MFDFPLERWYGLEGPVEQSQIESGCTARPASVAKFVFEDIRVIGPTDGPRIKAVATLRYSLLRPKTDLNETGQLFADLVLTFRSIDTVKSLRILSVQELLVPEGGVDLSKPTVQNGLLQR